MNFLIRLLGADITKDGFNADDYTSGLDNTAGNFYVLFQDIMAIVMPIVLGVVLALGVFFCVKLGIAYAKTEKTEDREEAKKRLVGAVIGFGIGIAAAAILWVLFTTQALNGLFA